MHINRRVFDVFLSDLLFRCRQGCSCSGWDSVFDHSRGGFGGGCWCMWVLPRLYSHSGLSSGGPRHQEEAGWVETTRYCDEAVWTVPYSPKQFSCSKTLPKNTACPHEVEDPDDEKLS